MPVSHGRLVEWQNYSLRSAFVVDPESSFTTLRVFNASICQPLPGSSENLSVNAAHSNLLRPGGSGLPVGWEMQVYNMRARTTELLTYPVLNFLGSVHVRFCYNNRPYFEGTLHDFVLAPVLSIEEFECVDARARILLMMKSNVSFECAVTIESEAAFKEFKAYLRGRTATFWIYLEGLLSREVL